MNPHGHNAQRILSPIRLPIPSHSQWFFGLLEFVYDITAPYYFIIPPTLITTLVKSAVELYCRFYHTSIDNTSICLDFSIIKISNVKEHHITTVVMITPFGCPILNYDNTLLFKMGCLHLMPLLRLYGLSSPR